MARKVLSSLMSKKIVYLQNSLRANRFIVLLSCISGKIRFLMTAGIFFLFFILWLIFFYMPTNQQIKDYRARIKENEKLCLVMLRSIEQESVVKKENEKLKKLLNNVDFSDSSDVSNGERGGLSLENKSTIDVIITIANNSNVACSRIIPRHTSVAPAKSSVRSGRGSSRTVELPSFCRESYELGFIGNFCGVVSFLQQLKNVPAEIEIRKLECCRMRNQQVGVHLIIDFVRQK